MEGNKQRQKAKAAQKAGWSVSNPPNSRKTPVPVGTRIVVEVKSLYAMDNYGVIEGIVKTGDRILFKAVIQAMRLNDDVA